MTKSCLALHCLLLLLFSSSRLSADPLFVAGNGTDGASCGSSSSPCRSISQAIDHASEGDVILVGPGSYGDADRDGYYDHPGDEAAEIGFGCNCILNINKSVKVISTLGAEVTVIEGLPGASEAVVRITASNAVLGQRDRGFTIAVAPIGVAGTPSGIIISAPVGVTVSSNTVSGARSRAIRAEGSQHVVSDNVITNSAIGLSITGTFATVQRNTVTGSNTGAELGGSNHRLEQNAFIACGDGLSAAGDGHVIRKNSFIGNTYGFDVFSTNLTITENNIYGNTCGLRNVSDGLVNAVNNYWGAASGPGPDPADAACDLVGSVTVTAPYAVSAFPVRPK